MEGSCEIEVFCSGPCYDPLHGFSEVLPRYIKNIYRSLILLPGDEVAAQGVAMHGKVSDKVAKWSTDVGYLIRSAMVLGDDV